MRICSPQLGLSPKSVLGGEVFDREVLLGIAKEGIDVEIILPKGKDFDKNTNRWHLTFIPIGHFPAVLYNLLILPHLYSIYRKRPFEIIRIHQPQFIGFGALLFKIFYPNIKLVATYHQFRESNFFILSKYINSLWNHIVCDSQYVKNKLVNSYRIPHSKITVVHNGVPSYLKPTVKDKRLVKKLKLEDKTVFLYMGLFIPRKNPLFLLDVLKKIIPKNKNVIQIYWGQGPLENAIIKKARKLGLLNNIRIQRPIFEKEKNKIHNLADIFVHPSLDEGFALAPLEAMACGKPVIMTNAFSASEVMEQGINGFLCKPDVDDWRERLSELISDSGKRNRMGKASINKVKEQFNWKQSILSHTKIFEKLVE